MPSTRTISLFFLIFLALSSNAIGQERPKTDKKEVALFKAIKSNNVKKVQALIKQGVNVNAKESNETTALMAASEKPEITELLLEAGADPNVHGYEQQTALEYATRMKKPEVVKLLLQSHANPNAIDMFSDAPLLTASDTATISMLLAAGADISYRNHNGQNALLSESEGNWSNGTVDLLIRKGVYVNAQNNTGKTALMQFSNLHATDEVSILIDAKAEVNLRDKDSMTALIFAVDESVKYADNENYLDDTEETHKMEKVVDLLLKAGANINARNYNKGTALFSAFRPEIIKLLISKGADPNVQEDGKYTPLMFAPNVQVANELIKAGANVNAQNDIGMTPLMTVIRKEDTSLVSFLIKSGANTNLTDRSGESALIYAINQCPDAVPILLDAGIDPNLKTNKGHTAISETRELLKSTSAEFKKDRKKYLTIIDLLKSKGAKD